MYECPGLATVSSSKPLFFKAGNFVPPPHGWWISPEGDEMKRGDRGWWEETFMSLVWTYSLDYILGLNFPRVNRSMGCCKALEGIEPDSASWGRSSCSLLLQLHNLSQCYSSLQPDIEQLISHHKNIHHIKNASIDNYTYSLKYLYKWVSSFVTPELTVFLVTRGIFVWKE